MPDTLLATIAVQVLGAAVVAGIVLRASKDHDRRLGRLEESDASHEQRISTMEGQLSIALPAKSGR